MARRTECTEVVDPLRRLFPKAWLEEAARASGWLKRRRKVAPADMFWSVVLGFGTGRSRSIAGVRRQFEQQARTTLVPSSFYDRFTPAFVTFLRAALDRAMEAVAEEARGLAEAAHLFKDVLAVDSTVLRLHDLLVRRFPGARTNHSPAAAKLHVVTSVLGRGPHSVKLTDGRTHDGKVRFIGAWVRDRLLLFDLGYYCFQAFSCIDRNGGFFITRLKDGANPIVVAVNRGTESEAVRPGATLQGVLTSARRDVIDLQAELVLRRRRYAGRRSTAHQAFRVVAIHNAETSQYHVYVTNIPAEKLSAEQVAQAYHGRWAIELLFKELKSQYRLEDLPSRKAHVVEALILASVLTLLVSQRLMRELQRRLRGSLARRLRPLRWSRVLEAHSATLLALVLHPGRLTARASAAWLAALKREAIDPNASRQGLADVLNAIQSTRSLQPLSAQSLTRT